MKEGHTRGATTLGRNEKSPKPGVEFEHGLSSFLFSVGVVGGQTEGRFVMFQMAGEAVGRMLFAAILNRIQRFGVPPPLVQRG